MKVKGNLQLNTQVNYRGRINFQKTWQLKDTQTFKNDMANSCLSPHYITLLLGNFQYMLWFTTSQLENYSTESNTCTKECFCTCFLKTTVQLKKLSKPVEMYNLTESYAIKTVLY